MRVAPLETGGREVEVGDPLVDDDQFAIRFSFDETDRASGKRQTTTKLSLCRVEASRIVREEVFYYTRARD